MAGRVRPVEHGGRGGGMLVVLVHGAVDSGDSFTDVVHRLDGIHAVTYDRRGCGSAWELFEPSLTLADHVEDLLDVVGGRPAAVVGHSLGGLVAIGAALRRPDLIRAVGLYETAMPWTDWWTPAERSQMLAQIDANTRRAASRAGLDPAQAARRRTEWQACRHEVIGLLREPFSWRELAAPVTVGVGTRGSVTSGRDARIIAAELGADLIQLPGAGHLAHRTHPDMFAGFVQRSVTRGRPAGT
jgi:pimeloyl-ACP methyl ester carboxylesterase